MEGAGIDVFATVKRAGISLRTLVDKGETGEPLRMIQMY